jgi:hypothetical protein
LGVPKWKKNFCNTTPEVPLEIWNGRRTTPNIILQVPLEIWNGRRTTPNTTPQVPLEIWKDHILGCKSL